MSCLFSCEFDWPNSREQGAVDVCGSAKRGWGCLAVSWQPSLMRCAGGDRGLVPCTAVYGYGSVQACIGCIWQVEVGRYPW
jgi:hypothetical protein